VSEFWVASDLPCDDISVRQGRILTDWCEAEVERACRESWEHIDVIDGMIGDDGTLPVNAFLRSDWDAELGEVSTVAKLIEDAAAAFAGGDGMIHEKADQERVAKMCLRIERVIAEVRLRLPDGEANHASA
jgi:hypothetical protein